MDLRCSAPMDVAGLLARALPDVPRSGAAVDRESYARDLWPRHHIEVRGGKLPRESEPAAVVWPSSTEEVSAIVRLCRAEGIPVVPFGAGSGVCAGVLPDARALV